MVEGEKKKPVIVEPTFLLSVEAFTKKEEEEEGEGEEREE